MPPNQPSVNLKRDPLSSLWSQILRDLRLTDQSLVSFVEFYVGRYNELSPAAKAHVKGNINRSLRDTKMTFKVFLKGLEIIGIQSGKIVVYLALPNGAVTVHAVDLPKFNENYNGASSPIPSPKPECLFKKSPDVPTPVIDIYETVELC